MQLLAVAALRRHSGGATLMLLLLLLLLLSCLARFACTNLTVWRCPLLRLRLLLLLRVVTWDRLLLLLLLLLLRLRRRLSAGAAHASSVRWLIAIIKRLRVPFTVGHIPPPGRLLWLSLRRHRRRLLQLLLPVLGPARRDLASSNLATGMAVLTVTAPAAISAHSHWRCGGGYRRVTALASCRNPLACCKHDQSCSADCRSWNGQCHREKVHTAY